MWGAWSQTKLDGHAVRVCCPGRQETQRRLVRRGPLGRGANTQKGTYELLLKELVVCENLVFGRYVGDKGRALGTAHERPRRDAVS